ncbi:MAG: Cna B-type domain-containing protein, partial [Collinsella sp.]|nr:Cna B-type domain-containing protein [Collinsella sp.]
MKHKLRTLLGALVVALVLTVVGSQALVYGLGGASSRAASDEAESYIAGNSTLASVKMTPADENPQTNQNLTFEVETAIQINKDSTYRGFTNTVVHHEFLITKLSASNQIEAWAFNGAFDVDGYQSWLSNATKESVTIDGVRYIKLSGDQTVVNSNPGVTSNTFVISQARTGNNDEVTIKRTSWLVEDGEQSAKTSEISQSVSGTVEGHYNLYNNTSEPEKMGLKVSGYYNTATGAFYATKSARDAAGDSAAEYGRFYSVISILFPTRGAGDYGYVGQGNERLDPAVAQTWSLNYGLSIERDGQQVPVSDPAQAPKLVDIKLLNDNGSTGFFGRDMTLGGVLDMTKDAFMNYGSGGPGVTFAPDREFYRANQGLSVADDGSKLQVSVINGTEGKNHGVFHSIATNALFFTPVPDTTVKRRVNFTLDDLKVTGVTGTVGTDVNPDDNSVSYGLPVAGSGGKFSQTFYVYGPKIRGIGVEPYPYVRMNVDKDLLASSAITAANQLIKVDPAYVEVATTKIEQSTFGPKAKRSVLYATKPDGSTWKDQTEQFATRTKDLVYYDSLDQVPAGHKVVGVLFEYRDGLLTNTLVSNQMQGKLIEVGTTVMALDTEAWADDNVNTVSYAGLNGAPTPALPDPSYHEYATDGGTYVSSKFAADGKELSSDSHGVHYGVTYEATGYNARASEQQLLNGTDASVNNNKTKSFNISRGERVIAASTRIDLTWDSKTTPDPHYDLSFDVNAYQNDDPRRMAPYGPMYVAHADAVVTWNGETNTFESADPSFRRIDDPTNVKLDAGSYRFYYAMYAGDETDLSKEISAGTHPLRFALKFNQKHLVSNGYFYNYYEVNSTLNPLIARDSSTGLFKSVKAPVVGPTTDAEFSVSVNSNAKTLENFALIDVLPFDGDARGSEIDRPYVLADGKVTILRTAESGTPASTFDVYYTTDEAVRAAGREGAQPYAEDLNVTDPTSSFAGVTWTKMTPGDDGSYAVAAGDADRQPTALIVAGTFMKNERMSLSYGLHVDGDHYGNVYDNDASYTAKDFPISQVASAKVSSATVKKDVSGTVWADNNHDGIRADGEPAVEGVQIRLFDGNGAEITKNVYGEDFGTVKSAADGSYLFENVPDSASGYVLKYELTDAQAKQYVATAYKAPGAGEDVNSDFHPVTSERAAGAPQHTDALALKSYDELTAQAQASDHAVADLGLVPVREVAVKKAWTDEEGTALAADRVPAVEVGVQLYAAPEGGEAAEVENQSLTLNEENEWKGSFTGQYRYDSEGKALTYSVAETGLGDDGRLSVGSGSDARTFDVSVSGDQDSGFTVTNKLVNPKLSVSVEKVWSDSDDQDGIRPDAVTVSLLANGKPARDAKGNAITATLDGDVQWKHEFGDLPTYDGQGKEIAYTVQEAGVDNGKLTVSHDGRSGEYAVAVTGDAANGFAITNTHAPEKVTVSGTKTWADADNQDGKRPESITVKLLADGEDTGKTATVKADADGAWTYSFSDLDKYAAGTEIAYTVSEDAVDGYTPTYDGMNVTNTHTPETVSVNVAKEWKDGWGNVVTGDALKDRSVTIALYRAVGDDAPTPVDGQSLTLNSANEWKGAFSDLPKYAGGKEITYTVRETGLDENGRFTIGDATFQAAVTGSMAEGFTVTNAEMMKQTPIVPAKRTVTVQKVWSGIPAEKAPEVTVRLYKNGEATDQTLTLNNSNGWTGKFTGLPVVDDITAEKANEYTVAEEGAANGTVALDGKDYTVSVSGDRAFTITNTLVNPKVSVPVSKAWADGDNQDGIRPDSVTVRLLANGEPATDAAGSERTLALTSEGGWSGSFADLPTYDADGDAIAYTVDEPNAPEGYTAAVTGTAAGGFTVTNAHTPATVDVPVTKAWVDNNNAKGARPDAVAVRLLANGEPTGEALELTADGWAGTFTGLPKYRAGEEIAYTVAEDEVAGYGTVISGTAADGFTVTNTIEGKVSVAVTKVWAGIDADAAPAVTVN